MIMEKKPSKRSLLSFFDWNGKSQKKLFLDVANQAKENIETMPLPMSQIKMDETENVESPSSIACSDFTFALSITSDEQECETSNKSPGLVARLMGLDSLPLVSMNDYCHVDSINMALKSNRMSVAGPLSASLRGPELQEKSEAAQHESRFNVSGKPTERRRNLYKAAPTFKDSRDSGNSSSPRGKGKFVSHATPSKTNVLSKDTLNLNGNRRCMKQKEIQSNQKNCIGKKSDVLRPNGLTSKGKSTTKVLNNKATQTRSLENLARARKTTNKCAVNSNIESKRSRSRVADKQKESSVSKRKSSPSQKKRCDQNGVRGSDNAVHTFESKSIKCNVTTEESLYNDSFSMTESRDVISFTFTSPLRRNMPESRTTTKVQAMKTRTGLDVDSFDHSVKVYPEDSPLSPTRFHVIDVDALSVMLSHINPPQCTLEVEDCSVGFESISDNRFNSMISEPIEGRTVYSSMQAEEVSSSQINESITITPEYKMNWSEQSFTRSEKMMELEYVKDILSSAELMAEELAVDETENMITPALFDILENRRTEVESYEEYSKLQRKAIFDCVSECLGSKCRQVFVAKCKAWPRWVTFKRKRWLAEEVYKEMLEFRSMEEEVVVDEIIRKEMLDFDMEAIENGFEIELDIVTFLIDELVSDLWLV